jgi:hypothetical protein
VLQHEVAVLQRTNQRPRCRSPKIRIRPVTSVRTVNTKRSAKQFARGHRGGILTTSMPASAMTASNEPRELTGPIADKEPEPSGTLAEVHHEVAGLLRRPGPVGMLGHTQDAQAAVARGPTIRPAAGRGGTGVASTCC